jgi:transposase
MRRVNRRIFLIRRRTPGRIVPRNPIPLNITLSVEAVRKLAEQLPSPVPQPIGHSVRPTLRPWVDVIDQIVREDAPLPKRVRTSAMQIFQKLREEYGYTGCYNVVQEYVREARNPAKPEAKPSSRPKKNEPGIPVTASAEQGEHSTIAYRAPEVQSPRSTISPLLFMTSEGTSPRSSSAIFCQSRRPQRVHEPEDQAFAWMRNVQQGTIPLDILAYELPDIPLPALEVFLTAATKGKLSTRNRAVAVMSYVRGINCDQICSFLQISTGSLFRYWRTYRETGTQNLFTRKPRHDKQSNDEAVKSSVFALLHSPPSAHGVNRTTWTMAELQRILCQGAHPAGAASIRAIIKESGFKWRHARVVLTSNDPDYKAKVEAITKILSVLKSDEAFFSVDEYGPFAIKMKGGKKLVAPGEQYVVPQWQKSKGWMILTAALELSRNQVTHFYSRKKNTAEMIKMADTLRTQYRSYSTIYLSWDAASWHVSKDLVTHLEKINQRAAVDGFPVVKTAPLPAGAQFLNVIESVFSGMARAIIHNSDYPSAEVAREAIDRYFLERNKHFSEHPEKAGKKIWGMERVPSVFAEGQNCKDPMYQYLT